MKPRYFKSQADFRRWLDRRGATERELLVGFYKKTSGRTGISYKEAVDEALCFGWIDGIKKRVDDASYTHRFTPRTSTSVWSDVNTRRAKELIALGLMASPGLEAFQRRDAKKTSQYSYERAQAAFDGVCTRAFKANAQAWTFFQAQPPGYRKLMTFYVMSAKKEDARLRRLARLITTSAEGLRVR
jgi:uncharacterized protein YdeI (YjbR/CyaY-like superfamily)